MIVPIKTRTVLDIGTSAKAFVTARGGATAFVRRDGFAGTLGIALGRVSGSSQYFCVDDLREFGKFLLDMADVLEDEARYGT